MAKSIYVKGFRTFKKNDNAPEQLVCKLLVTPEMLFEQMKSGELDEAQSEYQGKKQYNIDVWQGEDGTLNFTANTFKPDSSQSKITKVAQKDDDLPF
ncbi:MAG: hypothetical protein Unbinned2716contig1001_14 [Prokaryotic dsDNA virus sp.]|nr:MAG: hypothetical protein Unbinned2716contig1001_14 [Prokaryotic dsDNA virus sp.]|tara:strand:+ start:304 stop:594 length:291 start_codon:yes stop_codon:yes gene_type:complete